MTKQNKAADQSTTTSEHGGTEKSKGGDCMKEYWYIFLAAILCAVFSKQIDSLLAKAIKDNKKRAVLYCVIGAVMLAVIGFFIYEALNTISQGFHTVILAMLPFSLFVIGIIAGKCLGKARQRKMQK